MNSDLFFSPTVIVSHRVWWRVDGVLKALVFPTGGAWIYSRSNGVVVEKFTWKEGWNEATCVTRHPAPNVDCHCGFWGMKEGFEDWQITQWKDYYANNDQTWITPDNVEMVEGQVEMKGLIIEHTHGYRAQFARPLMDTIVPVRS